MNLTDDILITESLAGSHAAFEELMRRYERLVFRVAWSYCRQRESALDISQDVFVKVYRALASYRGGDRFQAWLMRITHNESSNWLRRENRFRDCDDIDAVSHDDDRMSSPADQENGLLQTELRDDLQSRLETLNPKQKLALTLRYFESMSFRDIAETLECSEVMARNIAFRGLQKLRVGLKAQRRES